MVWAVILASDAASDASVQRAFWRRDAGRGRRFWLIAAVLASTLAAFSAFAQDNASATRHLNVHIASRQGDFDQMLQRRVIRVALPYSRTLFFVGKGQERGIAAENVRDFERWLNNKHAKVLGKRPLTVILIPTTRDKLFSSVTDGIADIAAGNLTLTEDRCKLVDFAMARDGKPMRELLVSGPKAPEVQTVEDLAGKMVHVRPSTSYAESLASLNKGLTAAGKAPMKIIALPDALEDEDNLEMLNAGLFDFVVVDDWKARMWAQVLQKAPMSPIL